mmetsp:Transcript_11149/g.21184  ORF Transcript_11149/g.21184 Transcript_11149/m.21184 type:complete len:209 (+) Transcript_11149:356-982(+)
MWASCKLSKSSAGCCKQACQPIGTRWNPCLCSVTTVPAKERGHHTTCRLHSCWVCTTALPQCLVSRPTSSPNGTQQLRGVSSRTCQGGRLVGKKYRTFGARPPLLKYLPSRILCLALLLVLPSPWLGTRSTRSKCACRSRRRRIQMPCPPRPWCCATKGSQLSLRVWRRLWLRCRLSTRLCSRPTLREKIFCTRCRAIRSPSQHGRYL